MGTTHLRISPVPCCKHSRLFPNIASLLRWRSAALGGSNLGELERFAAADKNVEVFPQLPQSYAPEPRFEGSTAAVSLIIFLVLSGIGADRILGLSQFFNKALLKWKEQRAYSRRNEAIEARIKLQTMLENDTQDEDDASSSQGGGANS